MHGAEHVRDWGFPVGFTAVFSTVKPKAPLRVVMVSISMAWLWSR